MSRSLKLLSSIPVVLLAACETSRSSLGPFGEPPSPVSAAPLPRTGWEVSPQAAQSPLYGWDGSPVGSAAPGTVERAEVANDRALEDTGGSRLVLLELYNQAVQERDEYLLEVEAQNRQLELCAGRNAELERRMGELQAAFDALGAKLAALEQENQDLAARLALAQVRRLEAEKAWLESAIAQEEARALAAPRPNAGEAR